MNETDFIKLNNCRDLLNGCLNRMRITDDYEELKTVCFSAVRYINEFYDLNHKRLFDLHSTGVVTDKLIL